MQIKLFFQNKKTRNPKAGSNFKTKPSSFQADKDNTSDCVHNLISLGSKYRNNDVSKPILRLLTHHKSSSFWALRPEYCRTPRGYLDPPPPHSSLGWSVSLDLMYVRLYLYRCIPPALTGHHKYTPLKQTNSQKLKLTDVFMYKT